MVSGGTLETGFAVVGPAILLATALIGLASCGPTPNQYLAGPEREFGVSRTFYGADLRVYHAALLTPNGIGLREPGFLVGVENLHPESAEFAPAGGGATIISGFAALATARGGILRTSRAARWRVSFVGRGAP